VVGRCRASQAGAQTDESSILRQYRGEAFSEKRTQSIVHEMLFNNVMAFEENGI
jgi:hypothetical protein